jgi:hypothetical protein
MRYHIVRSQNEPAGWGSGAEVIERILFGGILSERDRQ